MGFSIITNERPKSAIAEAYRTIRTNLEFFNVKKNMKKVLITSTMPGEGKTTTICNIAEVFSQSGKRVLIVDADMRRPYIHKAYNLRNTRGLSNYLSRAHELEEVIQKTESGVSIITSGPIPPNPSELLSSSQMEVMFTQLDLLFDIVLIDSPPVGLVTDSAIVSKYVDGIILVVAYDQVQIDMIQRAKTLLMNIGGSLLGVIFTKVPISKKEYCGHRYADYYGTDKTRRKLRKKKPKGRSLL